MSREDILQTILSNIADNLDDIDPADIDTSLSMADYGANSLDVIEIVSCTMRDLRIKIPRAELSKIESIDGFAEALHQYAA